jgi:hypothetical protein
MLLCDRISYVGKDDDDDEVPIVTISMHTNQPIYNFTNEPFEIIP